MRDNQLDAILDRLRDLFHEEYNRGGRDALKRIFEGVTGIQSGASRQAPKRGRRQRAAHGSSKALIERVLKEKKIASVPMIMAAARSPTERRVSVAAVRFELYRGKKARTYRNSNGQWSLAASGARKT